MDDRTKQIRIFFFAAIVVFVLYGAYAVLTNIRHAQMAPIAVQSAPSGVKLTFNGHNVSNSGTVYVSPGSYTWKATRDHFKTRTGSFSAKKGVSQNLYVYLQPSDSQGSQYLQEHPTEAYKIEGLTGTASDQSAAQQVDIQPFIEQLPFIGPGFEYRVDYGTTPDKAQYPSQPGVYISTNTDQGKQDARDWIVSQGFNPAKMNIVYQAYDNSSTNNDNAANPADTGSTDTGGVNTTPAGVGDE